MAALWQFGLEQFAAEQFIQPGKSGSAATQFIAFQFDGLAQFAPNQFLHPVAIQGGGNPFVLGQFYPDQFNFLQFFRGGALPPPKPHIKKLPTADEKGGRRRQAGGLRGNLRSIHEQLQAEDEIILAVIMAALTNGLL